MSQSRCTNIHRRSRRRAQRIERGDAQQRMLRIDRVNVPAPKRAAGFCYG